MSDDPSTEALLFEVLSYDVLCTGLLDYVIACYLGRDAYCAGLIEREFVERKDADWKRRTLRDLLKHECMDYNPYDALPENLRVLSVFRNQVAHSQTDHGNVLRRLRRTKGQNEVWEITRQDVAEQRQRGLVCHSQLLAATNRLIYKAHPEGNDEPLL